MARANHSKGGAPGAGNNAGKGISSGKDRAAGRIIKPRMPQRAKGGTYLTDPRAVEWYRVGTKLQDIVLAFLATATTARNKRRESEAALSELQQRLDDANDAYAENENAATFEAMEEAQKAYDMANAAFEDVRHEHNTATTIIMMLNGCLQRLGGEVRRKDDKKDENGVVIQVGEEHKERKERFKQALAKMAGRLPEVSPNAKLPSLGVLAIATGMSLEETTKCFTVEENGNTEVLYNEFPDEVKKYVTEAIDLVKKDKQEAGSRREARGRLEA